MTIRRKYGVVLFVIFIISFISFNGFMDKFFNKSFKSFISNDMREIYNLSVKNLEDYMTINDINKKNVKVNDLNNKIIKFIVERAGCEGVLYSLNEEVLATGITGNREVDFNNLNKVPTSFDLVKSNKTVIDIEQEDDKVLGRLSYSIYGEEDEVIGVLVLIKDYSEEFIRNNNTKKLVNIIVSIMFLLIFTTIYFLSSMIIKPIIILKDKFSEMSKGKYPNMIETKSKDEIGVLINSFNIMSEKLRKKDEQEKNIFRNITHELKTPLTNISGYAQILIEEDFNDEKFKNKALNRIISESNRLHDLVISLLNISKQSSDLEEYNFEEVNIKNIVEEEVDMKMPKIKEKNLKVIINGTDIFIKGNNQYLKMLINNLIDNGIKYSNKDTDIVINIKERDNYLIFSILTKGKPISLKLKEKIFEPFIKGESDGFSSKDSNGLGLYICKNIVLAHGGIINLNLNKDESEFIVQLPKS